MKVHARSFSCLLSALGLLLTAALGAPAAHAGPLFTYTYTFTPVAGSTFSFTTVSLDPSVSLGVPLGIGTITNYTHTGMYSENVLVLYGLDATDPRAPGRNLLTQTTGGANPPEDFFFPFDYTTVGTYTGVLGGVTDTLTVAAQSVAPTGSFGFLWNSAFVNPTGQGGIATLGVIDFDGVGNVSGSFTQEFGNVPQPMQTRTGTFTGTYSSNPDGTGSISITADNGDNLTFAMVIAEGGHDINFVVTGCSCNLFNGVLSGVARHKRRHTSQSVAALLGSYGGQFSKSPQPTKDVVVLSFDGAGNIAASTTSVHAGEAAMSGAFAGTYTVNPDETGTITLAAIPGVQAAQTFVFVITDGGAGLLLLQTDRLGDGVSFGTARRQ